MAKIKNTLTGNSAHLLPDILKNNLVSLYGDSGLKWLQNLSQFISDYENKWQFRAGNCFHDAQFNVVLNATRNDNTPVVFKCTVPNKEFITEAYALKHYDGCGAARLLKLDIDSGAMLIEKINPGTILESVLSSEDATKYAVEVCQKLHKPIDDTKSFPTLSDWFKGFDRLYQKFHGETGPFSKPMIEKAKKVSHQLLLSQSKVVLLHGDLHYANLLLSNDHYVAIDPKGIIGEPEFEIPLPRVNSDISKKELLYRLDCFVELTQFDKKRIYSWVFCKSALAAWWTVEDSGTKSEFTDRFLKVAELMDIYV